METTNDQDQAASLLEAYSISDSALRVRQARICSVLSLVLVPACIGLDYFAYPHLLARFFAARLICDAALLICFALLFTAWGKRHVHILGSGPPLLPCFAICWMIYASDGMFSPYYAGLNIVLVGVILLIPYTLREAGWICGIVVTCYALACGLHRWWPPANNMPVSPASGSSSFFNNFYFLAMTTALALAACHYTSVRRFEEFSLRFKLDLNNRELATTLAKLQETEVQLVQSEKMNALGKLSAGLLHEVNNPLNFTLMALQVAEQEAGENDGLRDTLKDIGAGMERIRAVIADLRAFAYPSQQGDMQTFDLEETIKSALRMTTHELGDTLVDFEAARGVSAVGSPTQVVQVFTNLLVNSAHALKGKTPDGGGRITVSCDAREGRACVAVRDNGWGVDPRDIPKLLNPFFTTKQPGQGMGLGLSICRTIVKNHGGDIQISSEPGQWTQVRFDLPLASAISRSAA